MPTADDVREQLRRFLKLQYQRMNPIEAPWWSYSGDSISIEWLSEEDGEIFVRCPEGDRDRITHSYYRGWQWCPVDLTHLPPKDLSK